MFESLLNFQPSRNNERFKPYTTYTIKERRLGKLFYTPAKRTEDRNVNQEFTPKLKSKYPYMSMQDKLDRLKKLIGELPSNDYHQPSTSSTFNGFPATDALTFAANRYFQLSEISPASISSTNTKFSVPDRQFGAANLVDKIRSTIPARSLFPAASNTGTTVTTRTAVDTPLFPKRERNYSHAFESNKAHFVKPKTSAVAAANPPQPGDPTLLHANGRPISISMPEKLAQPDSSVPTARRSSISTPSVQAKWRDQKFKDEKELRMRRAKQLEDELREREKARHIRTVEGEEDRRLRFYLEGLRLERRIPPREEFPALTPQLKQIIRIIWDRHQSPTEVLAKGFGADITRKDLLTLSGTEWLNDEVINFFLNLVVERNLQDQNLPNVHTFNTFFYQKLCQMGFAGVKRWTKKVDIFAHQLLLVPVHLGNHWCMAIVDFDLRRIDYFDSLYGDNEECLQALSDYLKQESMDKLKQQFDTSDWTFTCRKDIPHQLNLFDCGMFACLFAEYASRRAPITFNQSHIPYFRQRMAYEIYQKKLLG